MCDMQLVKCDVNKQYANIFLGRNMPKWRETYCDISLSIYKHEKQLHDCGFCHLEGFLKLCFDAVTET